MQVRTFQARQMREALAIVRREMGADAMILTTKKLRRGFGLLGTAGVEITAAVDNAARTVAPTTPASTDSDTERQLGTLRREIRVLRDQLRETSDIAADLTAQLPRPGAAWQQMLEELDIDPTIAAEIVRGALARKPQGDGAGDAIHAGLEAAVIARIATAEPLEQTKTGKDGSARIVAIVGPTGVGKTTSIAKIAARATLARDLRVALVTLDTYRIGAVSQLTRYAQLIGVPLEVVRDPAGFQAACRRHASADLILCDTAGRADDQAANLRLSACLSAIPSAEIYLAVSAATRRQDLRAVLNRFAPLGPTRLIVTKTDETRLLGGVLNAVSWSGLPLVYLTSGQRVPEDIEEADAATLGPRILRGETN